jgi:multiple sugar transport system substrate-binding protein
MTHNDFPLISRRGLLKAVTIAGGALLAGCTPRGVPGARVTLTQWYHQYGETGTQQAVLRYAQQYTQMHPDIAVRVVWVPGDYATKVATALLTPDGPDIFEGSITAAMVGANQVASLDDLFTPAVLADFSPQDIAQNTVNGHIYGIKTVDDTGLLYYRKSVLAAAGLEPPTTMAALLEAAAKLTQRDRKGLFIGNDGGINALINLIPWSAGADFLVGHQIVFDTSRTVAAYEALRTLNTSNSLLIGAPSDWWDPSAFTQGLTAMQWTGLWAYPAMSKAFGEDLGAVPWPALDAEGASVTFLGGWAEMVNAQSAFVEEAKKYVQWLWIDNKKDQRDWTLGYGFHVPPSTALARSATPLRAPVPAVAVEAIRKNGRFLPPLWNAAMTTALTNALTNGVKLGQPFAPQVAAAAQTCRRELERQLE